MKRKTHKAQSRQQEQITFLNNVNINNTRAIEEGPIKKKWSEHDLKCIKPLTPAQEDMFHAFFNGKHICAHGTAGTGKTFLALYLAFREVLDKRCYSDHIIIVRSNVSTRKMGHLPGKVDEKMAEFEVGYRTMCAELFGRFTTYDDMKSVGLITFISTSFIRSLTWNNAVVIVEEGQNLNFHEINSIMTRIGKNTTVIVTGDKTQTDLTDKNEIRGISLFLEIIKEMKHFETIQFNKHDIVRSEFVKSWIIATEQITQAA